MGGWGRALQAQEQSWGPSQRRSLNCSVPRSCIFQAALGGDSCGEGEGWPCFKTPAPSLRAGKSLSLSITLLRINFVEIKIGLGINSASRIFSAILEAAEGSEDHSQSWLLAWVSGAPTTS